jgi:hypothetical protein
MDSVHWLQRFGSWLHPFLQLSVFFTTEVSVAFHVIGVAWNEVRTFQIPILYVNQSHYATNKSVNTTITLSEVYSKLQKHHTYIVEIGSTQYNSISMNRQFI